MCFWFLFPTYLYYTDFSWNLMANLWQDKTIADELSKVEYNTFLLFSLEKCKPARQGTPFFINKRIRCRVHSNMSKNLYQCNVHVLSILHIVHVIKLPWRNWLARSAVNRKVAGSSPAGSDDILSVGWLTKSPPTQKVLGWKPPGWEYTLPSS